MAKEIYPDWVCRFYVAKSVPKDIIDKLKFFDNVQIVEMNTGAFWRFYPVSDKDIDIVIIRDCDSRVNNREREAVDEWLKSDKGFHIMRDHPHHKFPIMGGMWGAKRGVIDNIEELIRFHVGNFPLGWPHGMDQTFLRNVIYPMIKDNCLVHDEFFDKLCFPSKRIPNYFVGQQFDENDNFLRDTHLLLY